MPVPLCVGMAAAAEIVGSPEGTHERERVGGQRDSFIEMLQGGGLPVAINGSVSSRRHAGNANLRFDGLVAQELLGSLQPRVTASTGAACTSGIPESSHVLRAIGLNAAQAESSVCFSFGRFTTDEEVQEVGRLVIKARGGPQALQRSKAWRKWPLDGRGASNPGWLEARGPKFVSFGRVPPHCYIKATH